MLKNQPVPKMIKDKAEGMQYLIDTLEKILFETEDKG